MIILTIMHFNLYLGAIQLIGGIVRVIFAKNEEYKKNLKQYWIIVAFYFLGLALIASSVEYIGEMIYTYYLALVPLFIAAFYCWICYKKYPKQK